MAQERERERERPASALPLPLPICLLYTAHSALRYADRLGTLTSLLALLLSLAALLAAPSPSETRRLRVAVTRIPRPTISPPNRPIALIESPSATSGLLSCGIAVAVSEDDFAPPRIQAPPVTHGRRGT